MDIERILREFQHIMLSLNKLEHEVGGEMTDRISISQPLHHYLSMAMEARSYGPDSMRGLRNIKFMMPSGELHVTPHHKREEEAHKRHRGLTGMQIEEFKGTWLEEATHHPASKPRPKKAEPSFLEELSKI